MKLSCLPVSFFDKIIGGQMSIADWARCAHGLGLDAIDLSINFFRGKDFAFASGIRNEIEAIGMKVAVLNTYTDFTHPEKIERRRQINQFRSDLYTAAQLGAMMVRVTAGQAYPDINREQGINWVLDGLHKIAGFSESLSVKLVFENHSKPGNWDFPDFCLPTDIFFEVMDGIGDTNIGILFDTANPVVYGDDPVMLLRRILNKVECVHVADTSERGVLKPVVLGTGRVPFEDIFDVLKRASYNGWFSIEEASYTGYEGVKKAVDFVRANT